MGRVCAVFAAVYGAGRPHGHRHHRKRALVDGHAVQAEIKGELPGPVQEELDVISAVVVVDHIDGRAVVNVVLSRLPPHAGVMAVAGALLMAIERRLGGTGLFARGPRRVDGVGVRGAGGGGRVQVWVGAL